MNVTLQQVREFAEEHGWEVRGGAPDLGPFTGAKPFQDAGHEDVTFLRFDEPPGPVTAGVVFVPDHFEFDILGPSSLYILCPHPRLAMIRFLQEFWEEDSYGSFYVEWPSGTNARIYSESRIARDVRIGWFSTIGPDTKIGKGTVIGPGCHIEHTDIGEDCVIGSNVTIGGVGFGYEDVDETGEILNFPHIGRVVIGDRVDIGSSTCIDRGALGNTVIGDDCKLDNLIHCGHGMVLGKRCKVIALSIIAGSCKIGDDVWIAPAAAIRDWRTVGNGSVVGLGAVVTKDVPPGVTVVGNPAKIIPTTSHRYK